MKTMRVILICLFVCLSSSCASSVAVSWPKTPPPPNLGEACEKMGLFKAVPTRAEGLVKLDPGGECEATYRCDSEPCVMEITSPAQGRNTALAFVIDVNAGVLGLGPSSVGTPDPLIMNTASIKLENSGYYGTAADKVKDEDSTLAGPRFKRVFRARGVGVTPPLQLTATVTVHKGAKIGQFGFRVY